MKKLLAFVLFALTSHDILVAIVPSKEYFFVKNLTGTDIVVNMEFLDTPIVDEQGGPIFDGRAFHGDIAGIPVSIDNELYGNRIMPGDQKRCITYYPYGILSQVVENKYYERLGAMNIVDKLRAILKSFVITDIYGNILLTLDDIKNEDFVKEDRSAGYYILQVRDASPGN